MPKSGVPMGRAHLTVVAVVIALVLVATCLFILLRPEKNFDDLLVQASGASGKLNDVRQDVRATWDAYVAVAAEVEAVDDPRLDQAGREYEAAAQVAAQSHLDELVSPRSDVSELDLESDQLAHQAQQAYLAHFDEWLAYGRKVAEQGPFEMDSDPITDTEESAINAFRKAAEDGSERQKEQVELLFEK